MWVIDPGEGGHVSGDTSFKMLAAPVASTVHWEIRQKESGEEVYRGEIDLEGAETLHQEIQFTRNLPPGEYTVRLYTLNQDVLDPSLISPHQAVSLWDSRSSS